MKVQKNETDFSKIEHLAVVREDENYRFRSFLKGKDSNKVDRIVHRLHDEITKSIDCSTCGNCCKRMNPQVKMAEIEVLAGLENITAESYIEKYCEEESGKLYLEALPCCYLNGTKCSVYDHRPEECRLFPYTHNKRFISRLYGMLERYAFCPIVFNLMERLKDELRFRR